MFNTPAEGESVTIVRGAAKATRGVIQTYSWYFNREWGWQRSQTSLSNPAIFNACMSVGVRNLQVSGCIGGRVGHLVQILSPFDSADTSIMIAWTAASQHENPEHRESATVLKYEITQEKR